MKRRIIIRVLFLVITVLFGFWLGVTQKGRCISVHDTCVANHPNNGSHRDTEHVRLIYQTAKFEREARKDALKRCCNRMNTNISPAQRRILYNHIIVDRKNKLLYCYVPKVASSNMKRMILTLQGKSENSNAIKVFDQRGFEFLSDFGVSQVNHMLQTYFKFVFVRNPLFRLVSAYRNKFSQQNIKFRTLFGKKIIKNFRNVTLPNVDNVPTFREFIKYVTHTESVMMNEHWTPIYDLCQPCIIGYNFVGSFEKLGLDVTELLRQINATDNTSFPNKQHFYGESLNKSKVGQFYSNITGEEFIRLGRRLKKDFECFHYRFKNT